MKSVFASRSPRRAGPFMERAGVERLEDRVLPTNIVIDYSLDNGFFDTAEKKQAIESVAAEFSARLTDTFAAMPSGSYQIWDPRTFEVTNHTFSSAPSEIRVFVAGSPRPGNVLATGGSRIHTGVRSFNEATDYVPISGSIAFDNDGVKWSFDGTPDYSKAERDFFGVVRHEMMHVLGISAGGDSWNALISDGRFQGAKAFAANNGVNPKVSSDGGHFAQGEKSIHQPDYDRDIREVTPLDWAALDDIGWEMEESDDIWSRAGLTLGYAASATTNTRSISSPTDVDFYRVSLQKGSTLRVETRRGAGTDSVDTYLQIFKAAATRGGTPTLVASNDDGGQDTNYSKITWTAPSSGRYYVAVSSFDNINFNPSTTAGRTNTSTTNPTGDYRLTWSIDHGDDVGHDTDTALATGLAGSSGNYTTTRTLDVDFDVDLFRFSANAGTTLTASTLFPQGGHFTADTYLRLFDANGRELIARDGGGGEYALLQYTFTRTGTYYVGVSWPGGANGRTYSITDAIFIDGTGDTLGDYELRLTLGSAGGGFGGMSDTDSYSPAYPDVIGRASDGSWWVSATSTTRMAAQASFGRWNEAAGWRDVSTGDFQGDGLTDVIGRTSSGQWYLGANIEGTFHFVPFGKWNEGGNWRDVRFGDFNGDRRTDVAARASSGEWFVGLSTGGTFATSRWARWNETAGWRDVVVGDFDGNGRSDVAGRASNGEWYVALSTGSSFTTVRWAGWAPAAGWRDVKAADFDADGKTDLAGRTSAGEWYVARSTGASFATVLWGRWNEAAGWRDVVVGDFGGDSRPDLIGRTAAGEWYVAATDPNVGFVTSLLGKWNEAGGWRDVMAADFAGNAKADVLARDSTGVWYIGENTGTALQFRFFGFWNPNAGWRSSSAATSLFPSHAHDGVGQENPREPAFVSYGSGPSADKLPSAGSAPAVRRAVSASPPAGAGRTTPVPVVAFPGDDPTAFIVSRGRVGDEDQTGVAEPDSAGVVRRAWRAIEAGLSDRAFADDALIASLVTAGRS